MDSVRPFALSLSVRPDGLSLGMSGGSNISEKTLFSKRGKTTGWNPTIASRWIKTLQKIRCDKLTGRGVSFTLTLGRMSVYPKSFKEYARARDNFFRDLRRQDGFIRCLGLAEFQRRGAIHLHGCCFGLSPAVVKKLWLYHFKDFGALAVGQHVVSCPVMDMWRFYLARHASRGTSHYQRHYGFFNDTWAVSGRMWFVFGDWAGILEEDKFSFECPTASQLKFHFSVRRCLRVKNLSQLKFQLKDLENIRDGWTRLVCVWLRKQIKKLSVGHVIRVPASKKNGFRCRSFLIKMSRCRGLTSWIKRDDYYKYLYHHYDFIADLEV